MIVRPGQPLIALAFIVAICFPGILNAQIDTAELSSILRQQKDKLGKQHVFMLYNGGKVAYKQETDDFNMRTQVPVGATSQWLTAALVMTFVQEGKLSLDDKVSDYLPIFEKYYKRHITIRHCLTHYTGIQPDKLFQRSKYKSLEEEVNDYAAKKDIQTNAGTEFRYSNIGYNIAGRVLEVLTKRTFERLMLERITRPLGLKNTTFASENYNDAVSPATGARSTPADLLNFMAMLMNKGSLNGKPVLSEGSVETLLSLTDKAENVKNVPAQVNGSGYAVGSWILDYDANNAATTYTGPSLTGIVPVFDRCRQYGFVLFTKEQANATIVGERIRQTVEAGISPSCK